MLMLITKLQKQCCFNADEDNTAIEAPKKSAKETSAEENVNEENQIVSAAEEKDFHVKVNGLVFNGSEGVEDSCSEKKISSKRGRNFFNK